MKFFNIASGSKGNATIVSCGEILILIDMGLTFKRLKEGLEALSFSLSEIKMVLVTHSHSDHTAGLRFLDSNIIYASDGSYPVSKENNIYPGKQIKLKDIKITCVPTSHDADNPLGFVIEYGGEKLVYITDTGIIFKEIFTKISNADYYIFESNHDTDSLIKTERSSELKQRILGECGHLSNRDAAMYLALLVGNNTKEILLAHLSEEANCDELALETINKVFRKKKISPNIIIKTAYQNIITRGGHDAS